MRARAGRRWGLSVGLVLSLGVGLLSAAPASAAVPAPTGLSPATGAVVSASPTLGWSSVVGAAKYEVQVATTSAFTTPLYSGSTLNLRSVPNKALPFGTVYWRVRSLDTANAASGWSTASFTVSSTAAPQLLSPANGSALAQPATPPLLKWTSVVGATTYTVEVSTTSNFVGSAAYTTKSTTFVVPDPKANGAYWWRVRALLSNGLNTANSPTGDFTIQPLAGVTTTAPLENASVEDVVLAWNPVQGAKTYDVLVSSDADFNTIVDSVTVKSTRYSPVTTYLNNQYFWKVRARNNLNETIEWADAASHTFRRAWPDQPLLVYPPVAVSPPVGGDVFFEWTPVQHASYYQLDVGSDPNFSPTTFNTCYTAGTTYTPGRLSPSFAANDKCEPTQGAVSYWRVRPLDRPADATAPAGVKGIFSPVGKFIYSTDAVALVSPANGATVAVPILHWQAVPDAESYRVTVTGNGYRAQETTFATTWTPKGNALDPAKGPYAWTVEAIKANNSYSPLWPGRTFNVAGTPPNGGQDPLTPLAGGDGSPTLRFPNLTWEPVTGADHYRVRIGLAGTNFWFNEAQSPILKNEYPYPTATDTGEGILGTGDYEWEVEAFSAAGGTLGISPSHGRFTIVELQDVVGQRVALTGSALNAGDGCRARLDAVAPAPDRCTDVPATPVLDWDPVPGASAYMVYVYEDRELTNNVFLSTPLVTTNTRITPRSLDSPSVLADSQAGEAYFWYVRPCKTAVSCAPDPISTDRAATHAFDKRSPAVVQTSPMEADPPLSTSQVKFSWEDYYDTNKASMYAYSPTTGESSTQSGQKYRVQVSQSSSFAALVDSREVDQTTYTAFDRTYPEGLLYWRVQAIDDEGNYLTWSPAQKFTKASQVPTLLEPVNGVVTNGQVPFRWAPTTYAGSYLLEVYKNNDTNYSATNRIVTYTSKQTAYSPGSPLPASTSPYIWRVARLDADGKAGAWSANGSFRSQGVVPSLVSPTLNEVVNGYSSYFSWSAVPGAVTYKFERKLVSTSSVAETVTTPALAWAPLASLASGSWQWRVTATDAANAPLATTEWRNFTVDNTRGLFTPITPQRVLDTRTGLGAAKRKVGPDGTITLTVPGLPASATAVALNVTATGPTASSYLTVFPYGQAAPTASNLNFVKGQTVPNMVTVAVGPGSKVSFKNKAGSVDVIADLAGYYAPVARSGFRAQTPVRVLDTRIGLGASAAKLGPGGSVTLTIPGLPADATAVAMNVTATGPTASSYLTVYPNNAAKPNASNLNYVAGQTVANMVVVAVGIGGKVKLTNAAGSVDLLADLAGYFQPDTGATFKAQSPTRVLDTRTGLGAPKAQVGPGKTITITVPNLPAGTTAVVFNVTATGPTASSYATVYPGDQSRPTASNLNYRKGQTVPNMVTVSVGSGGRVSLTNAAGSVDLIADLAGAYIAP